MLPSPAYDASSIRRPASACVLPVLAPLYSPLAPEGLGVSTTRADRRSTCVCARKERWSYLYVRSKHLPNTGAFRTSVKLLVSLRPTHRTPLAASDLVSQPASSSSNPPLKDPLPGNILAAQSHNRSVIRRNLHRRVILCSRPDWGKEHGGRDQFARSSELGPTSARGEPL
ncbi:hypothetical protein B0H21DRAFT_83530 [Amylocystis lapponica]|nr:hypothetical protein B0H21DRAFT_83530 [Amylocystis lapponica]